MSNLDTFVVNVAPAPDRASLPPGFAGPVSWVLNAYAVILAALLVPAGNLADRYGARPAYLTGIVAFSASSLACSLAPGVWWLVGFRVVQAAGAALLIPASLGLLLAAAPEEKRLVTAPKPQSPPRSARTVPPTHEELARSAQADRRHRRCSTTKMILKPSRLTRTQPSNADLTHVACRRFGGPPY